jgi:hypothetical protein
MRNLLLILTIWLQGASLAMAFEKPVVSGSIQRGAGVTSFDLTVSVGKAKPLQSGETDLFARLQLFLNQESSAVPINTAPDAATADFSWSADAPTVQGIENELVNITYKLRVTAKSADTFKAYLDKNGGKSIKAQVKYKIASETNDSEVTSILVSAAVVKSAPQGFAIDPKHKQLNFSWSTSGTVVWTGTNQSGTPSALKIVLIDKDRATLGDLPAYLFSDSTDSDGDQKAPDGTCSFNEDFTDGSECVTCSDANAYLDTTKLAEIDPSFVKVISASPASGLRSITELENDKAYVAFAYYEPGGLARSVCLNGVPKPDTSGAEFFDEGEATASDPRCVIATAAYGSSLHKNLKPLRWFRDRFLMTTELGRRFVDWYYEHGQVVVPYVASQPLLQYVVRAILWVPVLVLSAVMWVSHDPMVQYSMLALIAMVGGVLYLRTRHRQRREY